MSIILILCDARLTTARHNNVTTSTTTVAAWPLPADALYSDRIELLQHDPEWYFKEYPRSVMLIT